jgi:hypothetical protein
MIAQDVIRRALRICGVIASGETPEASDVADALDTFNVLLAEWHEADIGIPDYTVETESSTMTTDLADRDALAYKLALRIGPEYGYEPSPSQMMEGDAAWARLALRYFQPKQVDAALPTSANRYHIDFDRD